MPFLLSTRRNPSQAPHSVPQAGWWPIPGRGDGPGRVSRAGIDPLPPFPPAAGEAGGRPGAGKSIMRLRPSAPPRLCQAAHSRREAIRFLPAGCCWKPGCHPGGQPASTGMDYFYRNGQAYEVWFAHEGSGVLKTQFGRLPFQPGDYIIIPYGVTWQMELEGETGGRFFVIEARSQIEPPPATGISTGSFSSTPLTASATFARRRSWRRTPSGANSRCG